MQIALENSGTRWVVAGSLSLACEGESCVVVDSRTGVTHRTPAAVPGLADRIDAIMTRPLRGPRKVSRSLRLEPQEPRESRS